MGTSPPTNSRTVVVLGASYAGHRAITVLTQHLPPHWRIVVLERNTHANHLYVFPRMCLLEGHEHKVFIPYTNIFSKTPAKPDPIADQDTSRHSLIHATVTRISTSPRLVEYVLMDGEGVGSSSSATEPRTQQLSYDFIVYALGSHLPPPINIWSGGGSNPIYSSTSRSHPDHASCTHSPSPLQSSAALASSIDSQLQITSEKHDSVSQKSPVQLPPTRGTKPEGMAWLRDTQARIKDANNILVVGGGALGVQFASDIGDMYGPAKKVTLMHSGPRLLPRFEAFMHDETMRRLSELGVNVMLMSRVDLASITAGVMEDVEHEGGIRSVRIVKTVDGRRVHADLVLFCTGQKPNTSLLADISPASVDAWSNLALVNRNLQLAVPPLVNSSNGSQASDAVESDDEAALPLASDRIFVIGDAADAFGALKAGHTAWGQAEVAARNICRLIAKNARDWVEERKRYKAQAKANLRSAAARLQRQRLPSSTSSDEELDAGSSTAPSLFDASLAASSTSSASSSSSASKAAAPIYTSNAEKMEGTAPLPLPSRLLPKASCDSSTSSYKPCGDACTCSSAPPTRSQSPHPTSEAQAQSSDAANLAAYGAALSRIAEPRGSKTIAAPCDSAEKGFRPCGDACTCGAMSSANTSAAPTRPSSRNEVRPAAPTLVTITPAAISSACDSAADSFKPCGDKCTCGGVTTASITPSSELIPAPATTLPPIVAAVPLATRLGSRAGTARARPGSKLWAVLPADEKESADSSEDDTAANSLPITSDAEEDDPYAAEDAECAALIQGRLGTLDLERYSPPPHSIKVSLGLSYAIAQSSGKFSIKPASECPLDLNAPSMWKRRGLSTDNLFL